MQVGTSPSCMWSRYTITKVSDRFHPSTDVKSHMEDQFLQKDRTGPPRHPDRAT